MHIVKGKKASKTECVFLPPPGFLRLKLNLSTKNNKRKSKMLVMNTKKESHESRYKIEETTYDNLPETRLVIVKDGFVTFFRHFKYLGSWISFSLWEDHDITKRIAADNASMGAMSKVWYDDNVDMYSKYLLFKAIPCNLLLWGWESWALRKSILASLEVFLHRGIRRMLKIRMSEVIKQHITNTSIREKLYNIPTIKKQITLRQLTYLGKIFRREESHIPTLLLTVWCDHQRKAGRPILTNKQSMARNIQQVIPNVDVHGTIPTWIFYAMDTQHWNDLLNTLQYPSFNLPENEPNKPL